MERTPQDHDASGSLNRMMQRPASHRKQTTGSDFEWFANAL